MLRQFSSKIHRIPKGFDAQVNCVLENAEEFKPAAPNFA
jgi:hypothetical protein